MLFLLKFNEARISEWNINFAQILKKIAQKCISTFAFLEALSSLCLSSPYAFVQNSYLSFIPFLDLTLLPKMSF